MQGILRNAVWRYDLLGWLAVILFFMLSAFFNDKDLAMSFIGAVGVISLMFLIGLSVEILIETIRHLRGLGTITGLLTNFPEALVVIVGLVDNDILFANSTPLGSNFVNPIVMITAALLLKNFKWIFRIYPGYTTITLIATILIAGSFFLIPVSGYPIWLGILVLVTLILFFKRPDEIDDEEEVSEYINRFWFFPSVLVLVAAGYFLDPVVEFASETSSAPKGLIGFAALSILSSWPEFKTIFALINRQKQSAGLLNTLVSNIINLWLAGAGVVLYWIFG